MENKKYYFAVDLGATSGRTILGTLADGKLEQEELTRFPNNLIETGGHFYWDIYALYLEMIKGLQSVLIRGASTLCSLATTMPFCATPWPIATLTPLGRWKNT